MIRTFCLAAALAGLSTAAASAAVVTYRFASEPLVLVEPGDSDGLVGAVSAVVRIDEAISGPLVGATLSAARVGPPPFTAEAGQVPAVVEASASVVGAPVFDASFFSTSIRFAEARLDFATGGSGVLTSMLFAIFEDTPDYLFGLGDVSLEVGTSTYAAAGSWTPAPIPGPASLPLLAGGLALMAVGGRLRRRSS